MIGGRATGGNDPTNATFVRPPQGNLISANHGCGVMIDGGATVNSLSGNFIGTTASGSAPLGNWRDGVAIVGANGNELIGTTTLLNPFVFYNVVSGNRGNGLTVAGSRNLVLLGCTVSDNTASGIVLNAAARGITVGGANPAEANTITGNRFWGLLASGWCRWSVLAANAVTGNMPGNVNTRATTGLTVTVV